ncbi:hypothetical protein CD58_26190 [Pseudomonas brassicacearum]|nr:hypothetical protein CD58_26190 [Pseudomonas brassicacearum]
MGIGFVGQVDGIYVARELAPVRLRSDRQKRGLLRSPAGASSLATGFCGGQMTSLEPHHLRRQAWKKPMGIGFVGRVDGVYVARELAPVRLRSDRQKRGLLRSPAGINPLATG